MLASRILRRRGYSGVVSDARLVSRRAAFAFWKPHLVYRRFESKRYISRDETPENSRTLGNSRLFRETQTPPSLGY